MKKNFIRNTLLILLLIFLFLLMLFFPHKSILATIDSSKPQWEQIIPEIGKDLLPESARETLEKIFPSPKQNSKEKNSKDNVKIYRGDKELRGNLVTTIEVLGNAKLKDVHTDYPITIRGEAEVKNSSLYHLTVKKSLSAKETNFKNLSVHGPVSLSGCKVKQNSNIKDSLTAKKSIFFGLLQLSGRDAYLKESIAFDIRFTSHAQKKILILNGSEIRGDITFEGAPGKIVIKNKAKIHGKINNGHAESR